MACPVAREGWTTRIRGIRANASRRSHQELNDAPDLDAGDPLELRGNTAIWWFRLALFGYDNDAGFYAEVHRPAVTAIHCASFSLLVAIG
jgi:hypothetical protein